MAGVAMDLKQALEFTELIKVSDEKHKYINTQFKKVAAKMYDYKCDIKLKIGKETFRAHRDILSEASDYFSAIFSHNMKEKEQDVIEFKEISPRGFTCMLDYVYHGHVTIDSQNIEPLLEVARFFHIEWLINVCSDFLIRHLSLENYDNVLVLSDKFFLGDLRYDIFRHFGQNFVSIADKPKFLNLSYELLSLLLSEDFYVQASEHFIFHSTMRWLRHNPEREKYSVPLLQMIRYPLFDEPQLYNIPNEILEVPELRELIEDAKEYHINPSKQCLMTADQTEVRGGVDVVMLISAYDDANLFQYKVPGTPGYFSEEVTTAFLQSMFEYTSVTALGNFVFVAGGYDRHSYCSSPAFYRYNPRNRAWAELTPMRTPRVSFALCTAPSGLYAVAGINHIVQLGSDQEIILNSVEYYDAAHGVWKFIPSLPIGCFSIAAVTAGETLFVCGGISDDPEDTVPVSHMWSYTPGDEEWTTKSPMLVERQSHGALHYQNKIYVFGGHTTGLDTMSFQHCMKNEVYDIETDQWTELVDTHPDIGHIHGSVTELDDTIYILGGEEVDRMLLPFSPEKGDVEEGEDCGQCVQKVVTVHVAFPFDIDYIIEKEQELDPGPGPGE